MEKTPRLRSVITDKIKDIPRREWESVFPDVAENYDFRNTLDESKLEQFRFRYIVIYNGDLPVGAATCFLMDFPIDIAVKGYLKSVFGLIKKVLPRVFSQRVLMCGIPMGLGRIGITGDPALVINELLCSLEAIAKKDNAAMIIFKDFTSDWEDALKPLFAKGFSRIESFPSTDMDISFNSFEEYMAGLSPASREGLKRKLKKADNLKIELEVKSALSGEELEQVYGLYMQTYNKQEMGLEKLTPEFFRNISADMPGQVKYFLWRVEGKMAAFALCLVSGDYFIDYYLGFDYAVSNRCNLYFVRFRDLMNWCIANGIKKYEMGVTGYEPKRRLGFHFTRLYFYIRHRNFLIRKCMRPIGNLLKPDRFDPVFDKMEAE